MYSIHLHLIMIVKINAILFSPLTSFRLNPVIDRSTTILTGVDTESIFRLCFHLERFILDQLSSGWFHLIQFLS